ncbi:chaperone modulator CbpM [Desulfolithobacter sp.]
MTEELTVLTGTLLDEDIRCSLGDLCRICNVNAEFIHDMVEEGVITPMGRTPRQWRFGGTEIRRVQVTLRLQRDLRINLPGCALVLDLLEELEELRRLHRR